MALASLLLVGSQIVQPLTAHAETTAYELTGEWQDEPAQVTSGLDVLGATWRFDVNDDAAAPSNDPVPNNVLTVTLENAAFTDLPTSCLVASPDAAGNEVAPLSGISADGRVLTCNLGTLKQGTAQVALTGVLPDGPAGAEVVASAAFRDRVAALPRIPIVAPFDMDAKFDAGSPISTPGAPTEKQFLQFPFSLSHARGAVAGPDSVSYELRLTHTAGQTVELRGAGCIAQDRRQPGHPFSAPGHDASQTTDFPGCTLEAVAGQPGVFALTLTGLDYAATASHDSNGQPLPRAMNVIAAGDLLFQVNYRDASQVMLVASAPSYTAVDGAEATDDPSNNENRAAVQRGGWTGGWNLASQQPAGFAGSPWVNTYRAPAGATVMSQGGVQIPNASWNSSWVCKTLDTEYVEFEAERVVVYFYGNGGYYDDSYEGDVWYYTGEWVDPFSGDAVDPNLFPCGTTISRGDPAHGNPPGWSTQPPQDLSTVKAVKVEVTADMGPTLNNPLGMVFLVIDQRIKPDAPVDQDIWSWTSALEQNRSSWAMDTATQRAFQRLAEDPGIAWRYGVLTPGLRYAYAGPGRDVIRVVGSLPYVEKEAAQKEYGAGTVAEFQVRYGLETVQPQPSPDTVVVTDTLPAGLEYVAGSAETEPTVTGTPAAGQTLVWTFENVMPNADAGVINFKVRVPDDAVLGAKYTNVVTAESQGNTRRASAEFIVPKAGYTTLLKETGTREVTLESGAAANTWTITMASQDPTVSGRTDTIDILPFAGDERGTDFSGTIRLSGPVQAPAGATVYYSTADPATLSEDPADASNGGFAAPSSLWSEGFTAEATAVRVVGGDLRFGGSQEFILDVVVEGAEEGDTYVNTAVGRAEHSALRMRTSDHFSAAVTTEPVDPSEPEDPKPGGMPVTGADGAPLLVGGAVLLLAAGAALLAVRRRRWR